MTPFLNVRRRVRAVVRRGAFGACVLASVSAHADAPPPPTTTSPPPPVRSDATAADDDEVVSVAQAVREAARKSPTLRAALLDLQEVTSTVAAEEDRYPLSMLLDANVARQETPNLNRDGVVTGATDTVGLGAELRKQFAWGTGLAFRLEGSWTRARFPILPNLPDTITLGPGYDLGARFTITQPLLRGFGTDVGEAELRAARYRRTSLDHARERVASETLRDVLTAYWELWFAGESLRIEREARALAARERDELQARIDAGATAGVDIYAFETRVRERDEAQTLADLERRQRSLELGRRMGRRRATALAAAATVPPTPETLEPEAELLTRALAQAPELAQLDAEVAAARDRERTAGEADRQRLDLTGALETRGLGNRDAGAAVRQFGRLGAFSAQLGLVYELPLTGSRVDSLRAAARAAHAAAAARRDEAALRIETTL
ncbi:MAG: TolC family protein, partial [Myxococcota bacterium]